MDKADRNYVAAVIEQARRETTTARYVANSFQLADVMERLTWALEFLDAAAVKLGTREPNANGATGSARMTAEGIELDPPKG